MPHNILYKASQIELQVHVNSINNRISNQTAVAHKIQLLAAGNRYKSNITELLEIPSEQSISIYHYRHKYLH